MFCRGVVQLFNAVQKQQKSLKEKLAAVGPSVTKQDKVLKSVKKEDFLDVLKKGDAQVDLKKVGFENRTWLRLQLVIAKL